MKESFPSEGFPAVLFFFPPVDLPGVFPAALFVAVFFAGVFSALKVTIHTHARAPGQLPVAAKPALVTGYRVAFNKILYSCILLL